LYNGEEIGMTDFLLDEPTAFRDNLSTFAYQAMTGILGVSPEVALEKAALYGRDKNRTPMQWRNAPEAGFNNSGHRPWLPVNPNIMQGVNVFDQEHDPNSLLNFYKRILEVRRQAPALKRGSYTPVDTDSPQCLAFLRQDLESRQACLVVLNMSPQQIRPQINLDGKQVKILFTTHLKGEASYHLIGHEFNPFEVYIAEIIH
jgi:glycosidase